jgi:D-alanyl-D-alanine carboxypeptidase (penicillin-binding protein 5/6)
MKYALAVLVLLFAVPAYAIDTVAQQAIVIDDSTGSVLFAKNADVKMHPSSMSKLMTVYLIFKHLKDGSLKLTDSLPVSQKAWSTQGSKMFVELGARIPVEDLLRGIIIQSGNDACIVMAEGLAGSEEAFVGQMNDMAKTLGMTNSHFDNATGLPDDQHLMSARDLATLAWHIIHDFPEYYHYFSEKEFVYHKITQGNRNVLLYKDDLGVDGLKTGHTDAGGYGIVVSGKDKATGRRVIIVLNGMPTMQSRGEEAERVLAFAYRDFDNVTILHKGEVLEKAPVWFGDQPDVGLTTQNDLVLTLPKAGRDKFTFTVEYKAPLPAPVHKGDPVGELKVEAPDVPVQTFVLVADDTVQPLHGFSRMLRTLKYYVSGQ